MLGENDRWRRPFLHQTTEARKERQDSTRALKKWLRVSCLQSPEGAVQTPMLDQLHVGSPLGYLAVVEHENHVRAGDGAETVSHGDGRSPGHEDAERCMDLRL